MHKSMLALLSQQCYSLSCSAQLGITIGALLFLHESLSPDGLHLWSIPEISFQFGSMSVDLRHTCIQLVQCTSTCTLKLSKVPGCIGQALMRRPETEKGAAGEGVLAGL